MTIWSNYYAYFALIGALAFGIIYNMIYEHFRNEGKTKHHKATAVVVGCGVLILTFGFFAGWELTSFLFALFALAGTPMWMGDVDRAHKDLQKELQEKIKQASQRRGPRDWPNFARAVRDDTAQALNHLAMTLDKSLNESDPHKLQILHAHALVIITDCLRRLESVDAPTRPPQP